MCALFIFTSHVHVPIVGADVPLTIENTVPYATDMPGTLLRNGFAHLPMSEDGTMSLGRPGVGVPGVRQSFLYFG